ncbi:MULTISPECIES: hypothetical protein [unclassified Bradyrhizobium]|nr:MULTISPECIES: hypothetical protein [unclassified Bradyrhizobium]
MQSSIAAESGADLNLALRAIRAEGFFVGRTDDAMNGGQTPFG